MAYKVVTQLRAEIDIAEQYLYIVGAGAPEAAARWYRNLKAEIESLSDMPSRCSVAPESEKLGFELKQLLLGKRTGVYRVVFRIVEDLGEVHVLAVRHGARKPIDLSDLA